MTTIRRRTLAAATTSALLATGLAAATCGPANAAVPNVPGAVTAWRDSDLSANQWALDAIGAPRAGATGDGTGITIAVLDTGADAKHPDLAGVLVDGATVASPDGTSIVVTPASATTTVDEYGHGTHVSGIIAAKDDGHGTRGAAPGAKIMAVNLLPLFNNGELSTRGYANGLIASMNFAANHGAKIISMSLGDDEPDLPSSGIPEDDTTHFQRICTTIAALKQRNIVTVVAAGNSGDGGNQASNPGNCADAVEVGATDSRNNNAYFSTYNSSVDIAAPGHQVLSAVPGGDFAMMSGTSMATPYVSAAFADVFSAHPDWTAEQAITAVYASAHDLGVTGSDLIYGHGLLDIAAALGGPATPVVARDTFAMNPRWATNAAKEGIVGWNAPATSNISGYTVSLLNTRNDIMASYDLGPDAVQMAASAPMNGRWLVNVVAHRHVGGDLDGGWTYLPYLGAVDPASKPSRLKATPIKASASAVTYRMTWTKGADADLAPYVAYGYSTDRTGDGPQLQGNADTASAFITVPRKLLAEDGAFYVWYPLGSHEENAPGTYLPHKGTSGAYVSDLVASRVKNVYRVEGVLNPSAGRALRPYSGQAIRVQIRNRVTKQAVSLTTTRLALTSDTFADSSGKTTTVNWYTFATWAKVPIRVANADLRVITVVKGRKVATAWVRLA